MTRQAQPLLASLLIAALLCLAALILPAFAQEAPAPSDAADAPLLGVIEGPIATPDDARPEGAPAPGGGNPSPAQANNRRVETGGAAATPAVPTTAPAGGTRERAAAAVSGAAGNGEAGAVERLRRVLEDPEARDRLLEALATLEEADGAAAASAPGADDEATTGDGEAAATEGETAAGAAIAASADGGPPPRLSLGRRVADATREGAEELFDTVLDFTRGLAATQRRLGGFKNADLAEVVTVFEEIALTAVATIATFIALRSLARPIWHALGSYAAGGGFARSAIVVIASALIDVLVVGLSWLTGYLIGLTAMGTTGEITVHRALFLNAFLAVELIKVVVRALIAPSAGRLRPLPLSDREASYWNVWTNLLVSILGYGLMLVVPLVQEVVNIFTARATGVLIYVIFFLLAMVVVLINRNGPRDYFRRKRDESGGDVTFSALAFAAQYLAYAIIAYLGLLFVLAVGDTGRVGDVVIDTLKVIGAVALGAVAVDALTRAGDHGVRLPKGLNDKLPLLERRLNTFVPAFLSAVRFIVFLVVLSTAANVVGLFDITAWLNAAVGGDAAATAISVALIILAAFTAWLALSSWVDYRLTPRGYRVVTSREQTLLSLMRNAATIAIATISLMFSLSEIGIDIAPLIASAGVFGLAIGFGAQKLVQDIITGVFIQFENACNVGDVITVGGITGTVEKLTVRSVSLRDLDGTFHVIPFSSVDMVSNYMRGFAYHVADLGIAYRENTEDGKRIMIECFETLRSDPAARGKIVGDLEWFGVQSLGDSAVVLRARIKTLPGAQWGIGRQYNELLKAACDAAGIEIPFPHMTVWMGEAKAGGVTPPVHIRSEGGRAPNPPAQPGGDTAGDGEPAPPLRTPSADAPLDGS